MTNESAGTPGYVVPPGGVEQPLLLYAEREKLDPATWHVKEHTHRHHEVLILLEGAQRARVQGVERVAHAGEVFVFSAGTPHEESLLPGRYVEKLTLGFSWGGDLRSVPSVIRDGAGRLTEVGTWIAAEVPNKGDLSPPRAEPLLHAFVGELFRTARRSGLELKNRAQHVLHTRMGSVSTVVELAQALGMSRSHFSRRFIEETGQSPSDFLRAEKLMRIRHLLRNTTMALKEIAATTGVSSEQQLCRLVRQAYGTTPRQLRGIAC